jgi:hypothetical protein
MVTAFLGLGAFERLQTGYNSPSTPGRRKKTRLGGFHEGLWRITWRQMPQRRQTQQRLRLLEPMLQRLGR